MEMQSGKEDSISPLMTLFVVQSALSFAQNRTVTGVVVDEKDEPIIGANVTVKEPPKERLLI